MGTSNEVTHLKRTNHALQRYMDRLDNRITELERSRVEAVKGAERAARSLQHHEGPGDELYRAALDALKELQEGPGYHENPKEIRRRLEFALAGWRNLRAIYGITLEGR